MADPHQLLAPLIEPPLPGVPLPPESLLAGLYPFMWLGGLVLPLALALGLAGWLWRRRAPQRALERIARLSDPVQAAHQLAKLLKKQAIQPPPSWQEALERVRFAEPATEHRDSVARLCAQARSFLKTRPD